MSIFLKGIRRSNKETVEIEYDPEAQNGGSLPISGFAAHEDGEFPISNSGTWIPDTVDYLSDDWTNQGDGHFLVATEALYHVECGLVLVIDSGGPADEVWADIAINETAWNIDPISFDLVETPNAISADTWRGYGSAVLPLGPDCLVSVVDNDSSCLG
jgi:hypothetical protein